jgi:hypothetical protein
MTAGGPLTDDGGEGQGNPGRTMVMDAATAIRVLRELSSAAELPFGWGVRPCDPWATAVRDRVLAQPGSRYAARREPGC